MINVQRFFWCGFVTFFGCHGLTFSAAVLFLPTGSHISYFQLITVGISWYMIIPALVLQGILIVSDFTPGTLFAPYFLGKVYAPYGFHEPAYVPYRLNMVLCPLRDGVSIFGFTAFAASMGFAFFDASGSVSKTMLAWATGLGLPVTVIVCALIIRRNRQRVYETAMKNKATNPRYYEECLKILCLKRAVEVS